MGDWRDLHETLVDTLPGFIAGKILCEWTEFFIAMLCDKLPEGSSYGFFQHQTLACFYGFTMFYWFKAWACTWFYQPEM
jgi:hypothetical protein